MTRIAIIGCMFSGKSSKLIKAMRLARARQCLVRAYKHALDTRYDSIDIVTHDGDREPAIPVRSAMEIEGDIIRAETDSGNKVAEIFIDEGQFFGQDIKSWIEIWSNRGIKITIAGLDYDSQGNVFGSMLAIAEDADETITAFATCGICDSKNARNTIRISKESTEQTQVGGSELYKPACPTCFTKHIKAT